MPDPQPVLNQHITGTKFLVFTGAGASAPLGYALMRTFMDHLEASVSPDAQASLQGIYADHPFADGSLGRDLEVVLTAVEERKRSFEFIRKFCDFDWPQELAQHNLAVEEIHSAIRKLVFQHYGNPPNSDGVRSLFSPLFTTLSETLEQTFIPVFTTNYDPAIETFVDAADGTEIEFGFAPGQARRPWVPRRFHEYEPPNVGIGIVLFKLHGSVTWYKDESGIRYVPLAQLDFPDNENMLIYPGEVKTDVYSEPYRTSYAYLRHALSKANYAFVIGYSFRDDVLQTVFSDALLVNQTLQVVVINDSLDQKFKDEIASKLGKAPTFVDHAFEMSDNPAYLQALKRLLSPAPEIAGFAWLGKVEDLVGRAPDAYAPDGEVDGIFELMIKAAGPESLQKVELFRVDADGTALGEHWSSDPADGASALCVFDPKGNTLMAGDNRKVPIKRGQARELRLAVSDSDPPGLWLTPGQWYQVRLLSAAGHTISSAPLQIPPEE